MQLNSSTKIHLWNLLGSIFVVSCVDVNLNLRFFLRLQLLVVLYWHYRRYKLILLIYLPSGYTTCTLFVHGIWQYDLDIKFKNLHTSTEYKIDIQILFFECLNQWFQNFFKLWHLCNVIFVFMAPDHHKHPFSGVALSQSVLRAKMQQFYAVKMKFPDKRAYIILRYCGRNPACSKTVHFNRWFYCEWF